jgi:hypothetical protein
MTEKIKVGLIIDDYIVSKQISELLDLSIKSDIYEIDCLILQRIENKQKNFVVHVFNYIKQRGLNKFIVSAFFRVILKCESLIIRRLQKFADFYKKFDLRVHNIDSIVVEPQVSKSGWVYRYRDEDLKKISDRKLEFLIRGGSGILRGGILEVCPKGIISFHHADNNVNRGGPPGFWEVLNKERSTGFIIQLLKDEIDGGDVIFKGSIVTNFMYSLNLAQLYSKSNIFMHRTIESLANDSSILSIHPKKPYAYPLYKTPSITEQIRYLSNTFTVIIKKVLKKVRSKSYGWGVAYQFVDQWDDVILWRSKKIKNPPNRYLADPFVCARDGKHYCFVEDYDYRAGKGCISVYEITAEGYKELGVALEEEFHLSYPYLIRHNDELYMCPETHKSNDIRLYKCVKFPLKWELEKILLKDISAGDTTIFYRNNKWWMLTNICSAGLGDHTSELHVFWNDDLLSDKWHPHPKNPVIFDALKARNGGLLRKGNEIFRVCQRQGWDMYGEAFGVSRISNITETTYVEEDEFCVEPCFFKKIKGTHTFSFEEGMIAIDYYSI